MRSSNSVDAVLADVVNEGKQHDIILKVQKSVAVSRRFKEGKQNDIMIKLQKSDAVNRGIHQVKKNDIILKFQK